MTADICVVVPTIREFECLRSYVENARNHGFDTDRLHAVLVTEDFCATDAMASMLEDLDLSGEVFDDTAREEWYAERGVAEFSHLVPAASHAETSFGLLYLWANGFEDGVFIDDDTRPDPAEDFFGTHLANLAYDGEITSVRSDEQWVNVLHQNVDEHGLYPRGYPYSAMGETIEIDETHVDSVVASQGLWTHVPDLDAARILADGDLQGQSETRLSRADYGEEFVASEGQYLTVCSMNLAFRREVIPAFYQLPMDDNPWNVGRFDDIWSGVFLKRACDVLGTQVLTGGPLCEHHKAPRSTFDDLRSELPALEANEHLWAIVDDAAAGADSYAEAYAAMADALVAGDWDAYENGDFLTYVGEHMHDWLDCLAALGSDGVATPTAATADD